jgi:hypothetical protein
MRARSRRAARLQPSASSPSARMPSQSARRHGLGRRIVPAAVVEHQRVQHLLPPGLDAVGAVRPFANVAPGDAVAMDGAKLPSVTASAPRMRASRRSPSRSVATIKARLAHRVAVRMPRPRRRTEVARRIALAAQADPVGIGERRLRAGAEGWAGLVPFQAPGLVPDARESAGIGAVVALRRARAGAGIRSTPASVPRIGSRSARGRRDAPHPVRPCAGGGRDAGGAAGAQAPAHGRDATVSSSAPSAARSARASASAFPGGGVRKAQPLGPPHCASSSASPVRSATSISAGGKAGRAPSWPRVQSR